MDFPSTEILAQGLPFQEAIDFFRQKVRLPTRTWTDIWEGMHSRAFVVAGAMKDDLLSDFQAAVLMGIEKGITLNEFRKDFDSIVKRHGWSYKGGRGWRSSVIFNTNMRTAYQTGHYKQMTDPDVLEARPYWRYSAVMDGRTRTQHVAWHNTVLRHDDPWWRTHYPPNGWGCRCTVVNHSGPEVERMKAEGEKLREEAPEMDWQEKEIRQSDGTTRTVRVPNGIDPGWAYNVGETAWGSQLPEEVMDAWRRRGAAAWERMTSGDRLSYGRPRELPLDITQTSAVSPMQSKAEAEKYLQGILGGDETIFMAGADLKMPVLVNARSLSEHIPLDRSAFLPFFPELIQEPYEVWLSFEKHKGTGKVVLRARFLKAIQLEKGRGLFMSAQTVRGMLEAWTFFTSKGWKYLESQRRGLLMFGR